MKNRKDCNNKKSIRLKYIFVIIVVYVNKGPEVSKQYL